MQIVFIKDRLHWSDYSEQWNELWSISSTASPLCRAENMMAALPANWPGCELIAIGLVDNNRLVAGLPLVAKSGHSTSNMFQTLHLPNNEWGKWGDLLIDPVYENKKTVEQLVRGLAFLPVHMMLRFNLIEAETLRWRLFLSALDAQVGLIANSPAFKVGMIEHEPTWASFESRLSGGFKKKLRKYNRRLEEEGRIEFELMERLDRHTIESVMKRVFEVESRTWKAEEGSTIRQSKKADMFLQQANLLSQQSHLRVGFLKLNGQDVAFDFGMVGKRTYHSWKIGFDRRYSNFAPGQVLAQKMTNYFHESATCDRQDTFGPLTQATASWSQSVKPVSNVVISGNLPAIGLMLRSAYWVKQRVNPAHQPAA